MPALPPVTTRLRVERRRRGWSQDELAAKAGLTQPEISTYERGMIPYPQEVERLAAAFEVDAATILQWIREHEEEVA